MNLSPLFIFFLFPSSLQVKLYGMIIDSADSVNHFFITFFLWKCKISYIVQAVSLHVTLGGSVTGNIFNCHKSVVPVILMSILD